MPGAIGPELSLALTQRGGAAAHFTFTGGLPAGATLTRASAGSYVGAAGLVASAAADVARFDHDPATLAPLGLLVEPARTNLLSWASDYAQSAWNKLGATLTPNDRAAPDGTMTATRVDFTATGRIQRFGVGSTGAQHVSSLYLWSASAQPVNFGFYDDGQFQQSFALAANVWTRVELARTLTGSDRRVWLAEKGSAYTVWLWGWQVEAGATASTPIPTTSIAATRGADVLTLDWASRGVTDGIRTIRYGFEDGSAQDVTTTIASGSATVPTNLNRRRIVSARAL